MSDRTSTATAEKPAGPRIPGPVAPGAPGSKPHALWPSTKRLLGRMRPHRIAVSTVILVAGVAVVLTSIAPRLLGQGTNIIFDGIVGKQLPAGMSKDQAVAALRADGQGTFADMVSGMAVIPGVGIDFGALGRVLAIVLALYVGSSVFMWLSGYLLNIVVQGVVKNLRAEVERKIHRLPLRYFDSHSRGDLLSRVTNDIDNVSQSLQQTMSQLIVSAMTVIGILVMMIVISPLLALIAVLTVPLSVLVTAQIAKRSKTHFVAQWKSTGALNAEVEEAFTGHELVTVFGRSREVEARFEEQNENLYQASYRAQFISGLIMPAIMFLGNLNFVAIAVLGGMRVASGTMSLGDVQAFIQYSRQFTQPLTQIGAMVNLMQSGVASAERVFAILDEDEEEPDLLDARTPELAKGHVEFSNVSFSYSPEKPLIENLSLVAEPGQMVAIVGPTGAGKTTLVNLILRFYDLDGGRILLDGVDIAEMSRDDLRSRIGMVLQDAWLFGGTIRDNIAYGRPDATEEEILAAARITYVDRFVHSLPDGYDTVIDEEGSNISAGEKQLITIARAFISQPSILILDEATSSVDTRTELLVQHATAVLRSDRTSFVIAHRLSTIRDADLIVVMEDGRIVEQGSHEDLLIARGAYYRLYNSQFVGADV
ncbi:MULTISPECIES: ABC transporter ATP-binding protein [Rhodococcus]|jgi:ATP-binding cassette subfamily B multidrug efflux pump|uniref:Fatty acid ABC transporter ATP-binding/permease protein n=1 Tax=Rhodococcus oxybenzonivorans TaxID=1990687 RepID=A0AAE5A7K7_9NOCA|nr:MULTISPECIES: ABC transporter ATP-binding protein [Rhodococcus]MDV7242904.1 ABC transporter ATP-binding protein [Rhodococcus oxybenzonivorans]MDV7267020.1 ABC transporter ATP-binding protein [Rhodococcus oxybenzonivorans]MDV7275308.1 ABC transporter ATP-binding protein [Rhodococcus oxybenzonivorans]MDV7334837.1 ABC transporter ATP-binding protein [Rhodococcus oxybenzonivorans]MDV7344991.1 ABC transporter ATP-binding protein [Rhodococcus oxybenzonivorans]